MTIMSVNEWMKPLIVKSVFKKSDSITVAASIYFILRIDDHFYGTIDTWGNAVNDARQEMQPDA